MIFKVKQKYILLHYYAGYDGFCNNFLSSYKLYLTGNIINFDSTIINFDYIFIYGKNDHSAKNIYFICG